MSMATLLLVAVLLSAVSTVSLAPLPRETTSASLPGSSSLESYVSKCVDRITKGDDGGGRSCVLLSWAQTADGKLAFVEDFYETENDPARHDGNSARRRMRANVMLSGDKR